jgi:hypothetical protein
MRVLAIDPGCAESAYVIVDADCKSVEIGKVGNYFMRDIVRREKKDYRVQVVVEMISSYGMPVGREVFETCVAIGRFVEIARTAELVSRSEVKLHVCGSARAKDGNVRTALIDRFATHDLKNGKGTKKNPDWFYGFRADVWQAYALAVTYIDRIRLKEEQK